MPSRPMTPKQRLAFFNLHSFVTGLLPVIGRDYTVDVEFDGDTTKYAVKMQGLTELGRYWVGYCMKELARYANANNGGGQAGAAGVHAPQPDGGRGIVGGGGDAAVGGKGAEPGPGPG